MEFQKTINSLDITSDNKDLLKNRLKFMINKKKNYSNKEIMKEINKEIMIKIPMLRSGLCDFSDVDIVVKGEITATNPDDAKRNKAVAFKNNAPFINCISKN